MHGIPFYGQQQAYQYGSYSCPLRSPPFYDPTATPGQSPSRLEVSNTSRSSFLMIFQLENDKHKIRNMNSKKNLIQ